MPWDIPFGVFYDRAVLPTENESIPIEIKVNYRKFPEELSLSGHLNPELIRKNYIHSLKDAAVTRLGSSDRVKIELTPSGLDSLMLCNFSFSLKNSRYQRE